MATDDKKVYLPKQHVRRGKAGYKGDNVVLVDRAGQTEPATKSKGK